MKLVKKYRCTRKCPELDFDNHNHCYTWFPDQWCNAFDCCPTGNTPQWELVNED